MENRVVQQGKIKAEEQAVAVVETHGHQVLRSVADRTAAGELHTITPTQ